MITGYFKSVSVPEVAVGENIKATIDFYALNPGALYWATYLVVDSPRLGLKRVLDWAREIGQEGGRKKTYTLGKMPDKDVAISFFLFAHDDAGHAWDWDEYNDWLMGFPIEITHLASEYKLLEPSTPEPELETLEMDITPSSGGYVTTVPSSVEGISTWYNNTTGQFEYGTNVQVTAHPGAGYTFDHWSDEIVGGVSYSNPAYVKPMTEHRAVKAHFKEAVAETETLEVRIDPLGAGYVTTSPPPAGGVNHFDDGDTGEFEHGETVEVTAHPAEGYKFESWSGEMTDTADNPAPVYPMTEHRRITAHFTEIVSNFSGLIEEVRPGEFAAGDLVKIEVDFKAYAHNPIDWPNWTTKLTATVNGMRDEDDQSHVGEEGHRTGQPLTLGTMPSHNLSGTVKLEAKGEWSPGGWQLLDTRDIAIICSGGPPPECALDSDCPPGYWCLNGVCVPENGGPPITCSIDADCPEGYKCQDGECVKKEEIPWPWIAAGVALLLLLPGKPAKKGK